MRCLRRPFHRIALLLAGVALLTPAERAEASEVFADTEWTTETSSTYLVDPAAELPPRPAALEDRTEEWFEFLEDVSG